MRKNNHIRVRISDELRQKIEVASAAERRSISNWVVNVLEDRVAALFSLPKGEPLPRAGEPTTMPPKVPVPATQGKVPDGDS